MALNEHKWMGMALVACVVSLGAVGCAAGADEQKPTAESSPLEQGSDEAANDALNHQVGGNGTQSPSSHPDQRHTRRTHVMDCGHWVQVDERGGSYFYPGTDIAYRFGDCQGEG